MVILCQLVRYVAILLFLAANSSCFVHLHVSDKPYIFARAPNVNPDTWRKWSPIAKESQYVFHKIEHKRDGENKHKNVVHEEGVLDVIREAMKLPSQVEFVTSDETITERMEKQKKPDLQLWIDNLKRSEEHDRNVLEYQGFNMSMKHVKKALEGATHLVDKLKNPTSIVRIGVEMKEYDLQWSSWGYDGVLSGITFRIFIDVDEKAEKIPDQPSSHNDVPGLDLASLREKLSKAYRTPAYVWRAIEQGRKEKIKSAKREYETAVSEEKSKCEKEKQKIESNPENGKDREAEKQKAEKKRDEKIDAAKQIRERQLAKIKTEFDSKIQQENKNYHDKIENRLMELKTEHWLKWMNDEK